MIFYSHLLFPINNLLNISIEIKFIISIFFWIKKRKRAFPVLKEIRRHVFFES